MRQPLNYRPGQRVAIGALLTGATVWGLIWYPYRVIEAAGLSGALATTLTYGVALVVGLALFGAKLRGARVDGWLVAIALSSAGCNIGYVLAMLHGEVMRVLLLFYLAPLWTLLLARLLLREKISRQGLTIMLLALAGMFTMLWQGAGLPIPQNWAEWIALSSGFGFASTNVLTRRAGRMTLRAKSMAVWAGVCLIALVFFLFEHQPSPALSSIASTNWILMAVMGLLLLATTWLVQFGVTHTPANRAAVIFMFELVVAAVSSYLLAGEEMTVREWVGGAMIIAAAIYSGRVEAGA